MDRKVQRIFITVSTGEKMKKLTFILIMFLVVLSSGIGIVSAETLTGTLGGGNITQATHTVGYSYGGNHLYQQFSVNDIEYNTNLNTLVLFDQNYPNLYDPNSPAGATTTFILRDQNAATGPIIATGTMGYQRLWTADPVPTERPGYVWFVFDNGWNVTGLTGDHTDIYANFSMHEMRNVTRQGSGGTSIPAYGGIEISAAAISYLRTYNVQTETQYTATKPSGIGITGNVTKTAGTTAKVYLVNGSTPYETITSEYTQTGAQFNFTTHLQTIRICVLGSRGDWYNTSSLFSLGNGTVTPTPTPTPTVTLNPGEFWLTFSAEDATTGGLIPGAEIDIYSEFAGTWNNATTTSGERTIATSQYHVFDAYGSATGYANGSALDKIAYPNQNYLVKLFPSSGLPDVPGYVNLFVSVTERETGSPISGVSVTVSTPGSYTVNGETDSTGSEVFSTSNSSVKYITVSKSGYKSETRTITTPASGSYNAALQMSRVLVTTQPTSYIPPGGVTPQITVDPRTSTEKDQDMMNMVRDAGPNLIQLAIVVTMISLLGLMTKGFGK
jgi:hypothetical protein